MIKKFTILALLLLSCNAIYAQTIQETISYINDKLYENHFNLYDVMERSGIVNMNRTLTDDIDLSRTYQVWSIDSKGKLNIEYINEELIIPKGTNYPTWKTMDPIKTGKIEIIEKRSIYLKELMPYINIKESSFGSGTKAFELTLESKNGSSGFATTDAGSNGKKHFHYFSLNNGEMATRTKNAILHLINLAEDNKEFYTKDPFAN